MNIVRASFALVALLSLLLWEALPVQAQPLEDQGQIDVNSALLRDSVDGWLLSADAEIALSRDIRQGLDSGVPLQFIVDFQIKKPRSWWFDKTLVETEHRFSLIYYELTRHYRLQSISTQHSKNYRSLLAALDDLGTIQGMSIDRPTNFNDSGELFGHISVRLDGKALPLPLQPLLSSTWRLASEDFTWSLN